MIDKWISVKVDDGLFPSERTVHFDTADGEVSVFVATAQLSDNERLKVTVLDEDAQYALVQVPSQGGGTVAKVSRTNLLATPR